MKTLLALLVISATIMPLQPNAASAEPLQGSLGASPEWGSGWIDFSAPIDFKKGDKIKLTLGGSAKRVMIRLLPKGSAPDQAIGIIEGKPFDVPESRIVTITLREDHKNVTQISVHGGPNPWGLFRLGGNGPATLLSAGRQR